MNRLLGLLNTVILLFSSFCVAAAVTAIQKKEKGRALAGLGAAILCGGAFLVNKYFEWSHKIEAGIYPNSEKLVAGSLDRICFSAFIISSPGCTASILLSG